MENRMTSILDAAQALKRVEVEIERRRAARYGDTAADWMRQCLVEAAQDRLAGSALGAEISRIGALTESGLIEEMDARISGMFQASVK